MPDKVRTVQKTLMRWFHKNQRDLPWRHTRDPYKILVSEVMLQQTQVDRVLPKYRAFLKGFPAVQALARATPRDVLLAWAGMGYNRRALYLLRAARAVVERHGGQVPTDTTMLQSLPGVGEYTAAAVATFSTGVPHPMADTNVSRVLSRVFLGRLRPPWPIKVLDRLAVRTMPQAPIANTQPALWGHALMDFGALVCRAKPRCDVCPLRQWCAAYPRIAQARAARRVRRRDPPPIPVRLLRGAILRRVRESDPRPVALHALRRVLPKARQRDLSPLLRGLVADGLLARRGPGAVALPIS